ncbi:MAG: hypothetical protein K9N23_09245 [Akkermansiaceae bacterium]|nr:hypothetical protein [Akkermansiaceae bacterium]
MTARILPGGWRMLDVNNQESLRMSQDFQNRIDCQSAILCSRRVARPAHLPMNRERTAPQAPDFMGGRCALRRSMTVGRRGWSGLDEAGDKGQTTFGPSSDQQARLGLSVGFPLACALIELPFLPFRTPLTLGLKSFVKIGEIRVGSPRSLVGSNFSTRPSPKLRHKPSCRRSCLLFKAVSNDHNPSRTLEIHNRPKNSSPPHHLPLPKPAGSVRFSPLGNNPSL